MKKFVIIDQIKDGDCFEAVFSTEKEAISRAEYEWGIMSDFDKKRRAEYYVAECDLDDDGCVIWDSLRTIKEYK